MMKKYLFPAVATAVCSLRRGWPLAEPRKITATRMRSHRTRFIGDAAPPVVDKGAQFAVLEGDPTASSGDYTIRLKMPDGFRIAPHWHPLRENVTVISGTFKVGMGDAFETSKMGTFAAGSFAYLIPTCTTTPWHRAKRLCKFTGRRRFSSTT